MPDKDKDLEQQRQQQAAGQDQGAAAGDQPPNIDQQDLDLVDDSLEDEDKDEAALWSEFDDAESGGGGKKAAEGTDDEGAASAADDDSPAGDDGDSTDWKDDDSAAAKPSGDDDADPDGQSDDAGKDASSDTGKAQDTDLWANATPEQRAAHEAAQNELKKLQHAERSNRGRISALQRQIAELSGQNRQPQQPPADAQSAGQQQRGEDGQAGDQGTDNQFLGSEEWKSFREEYPEVAGPLEKVIQQQQGTVTRLEKELSAIGEDRRQSALDEQASLLAESHSDWEEVVADDSFVDWLESQPRHIREAAVRNAEHIVDAEEAADVVGRFKAFRADAGGGNAQQQDRSAPADGGEGNRNQQARRQRQLESASTARSRGPGVATGIPEDGDPETIWKQFDEQERRQAGGA